MVLIMKFITIIRRIIPKSIRDIINSQFKQIIGLIKKDYVSPSQKAIKDATIIAGTNH